MLLELTAIVTGYLLGSIPTAYIVAKLRKGIDIREVDVGNVGGASVMRQVGRWEGSGVVIVDMSKGAGTVLIAQALSIDQPWVLAAGFAAFLGHNFPIFIGFRGGKAVATIMGIFFVLAPKAIVIMLIPMGIALLLVRNIFLMVAIVSPLLPLFIWLFDGSPVLTFYALAIIAFVLFRSRYRLKEFKSLKDKFGKKKHPQSLGQNNEIVSPVHKSNIKADDLPD